MQKNVTYICCLRQIVLSLISLVSSISYAYDFEVDGLCYNIIGSDQLEVTYRDSNGGSYTGTLQIPERVVYNDVTYNVTSIGESAFRNCTQLKGSLIIPNSVISIGEAAFHFCSGFTGTLAIPNSVTSISNYAFWNCSGLTSLFIPSSVISIGNQAFHWCDGLTSIKIEQGNPIYDSRDNCNAIIETKSNTLVAGCINTTIPSSVTSIGDSAFDCYHGLTGSLIIPNSVISIGESAFHCTGLTSLFIPNSVISIGEDAFTGCEGLTSIKIEQGNPIYDSRDNCNAIIETKSNTLLVGCINTTIPSSVSSIGDYAFNGCSGLTGSMIIPNSVTSIGEMAFSFCSSMNAVTIPNSVTSIGDGAFYLCNSLKHVYSDILIPFQIGYHTFSPISRDAILHIPKGTKAAYSQYENWVSHFNIVLESYTLSIKVTGNGSVSYRGSTIRGETRTFSVDEGMNVSMSITPDNGYRIKSLKVNGSNMTATDSFRTTINADTSIEVEFEAIPVTTYTLSIKATGNGSASYNGETIRGKTKTYTVNEGTSVTIIFTPDNGYRIKSLKVNGANMTANTSYKTTINADTSIEVEFEEIPDTPTTYSLTIEATGNGSALYGRETIRNTKKSYTVDEGTSVTITFSTDDGYRIKSLKVNNVDATVSDSYTTKVNADTKVEVEFEEIPVTTYSLSIKAVGNGSVTYNDITIRDDSQAFIVNEGSDVIITFIPDDGYRVKTVKHDGEDVTLDMIENSYIISDIHSDAIVEAEFEERVISFSADGISYQVVSWENLTLRVVAADDGLTIEIPDKISNQSEEWTVTGIDGNVLDDHETLAAIIWNPEAQFTARVSNPNLLLYVKDEQYAPATIKNVVVNGYANSITLTDAQSGNNFYCPRAFTAGSITYSHRYWMKTGLHESRGWETIALPFDVQKISHSTKGEIIPFANWHDGDSTYPFWLYQLSANGFIEADAIKANTPYIISMPNNDRYSTEYHLNGRVDFTAKNVEVKRSDDIQTSAFSDRTFIPNFVEQGKNAGYYALNVNNEYEVYQGKEAEGSRFVLNLRQIHPFEAYMTSSANTRSIGIFDGMTTDIRGIKIVANEQTLKVYDLSGKLYKVGTSLEDMKQELPAGVYIVNHQKMIIK